MIPFLAKLDLSKCFLWQNYPLITNSWSKSEFRKIKRQPKTSNFLTNNVIFLVNLGKMCFLWPNYPLKMNSGTRTDFNDVISPWILKNQNGDQKPRILYGNIVHWIQILIHKWIRMMFLLRKSKKKLTSTTIEWFTPTIVQSVLFSVSENPDLPFIGYRCYCFLVYAFCKFLASILCVFCLLSVV